MFEIGDLVQFRVKQQVCLGGRAHSEKKIALVTSIERNVYWSYDGDKCDRLTVLWLNVGIEETIPEFYLEELKTERCQ